VKHLKGVPEKVYFDQRLYIYFVYYIYIYIYNKQNSPDNVI
jgi:hypothetical protein